MAGGKSRSRRSQDMEMQLMVPTQAGGLVLGRGGANRDRLCSHYNVNVVLGRRTPEQSLQTLTITGKDREQMRAAANDIRECLQDKGYGISRVMLRDVNPADVPRVVGAKEHPTPGLPCVVLDATDDDTETSATVFTGPPLRILPKTWITLQVPCNQYANMGALVRHQATLLSHTESPWRIVCPVEAEPAVRNMMCGVVRIVCTSDNKDTLKEPLRVTKTLQSLPDMQGANLCEWIDMRRVDVQVPLDQAYTEDVILALARTACPDMDIQRIKYANRNEITRHDDSVVTYYMFVAIVDVVA